MSITAAPKRRAVACAAPCTQIPRSGSGSASVSLLFYLMALTLALPAAAQVAPDLGTAAPYTVLATNGVPTTGTVTCTTSTIDGDVGTTGADITNTGCAIAGTIDSPVAAAVVADFDTAFNAVDGANPICDGVIPTASTTLAPGVYCSVAGTTIGAGVTITLDGDASDTWVFRVGTGGLGALTLTDAQVVMAGSADACNVFWKTAEAATLTGSNFVGTVLSGAAISMSSGTWFGRALATTDVTVTSAAPLAFSGCAAVAAVTVSKDFSDNNPAPVSVNLSCSSGVVSSTPLDAAEGAPAVFTVSLADLAGTTCTATETVPLGYTADESDCLAVALDGSCTITNTLIPPVNTITVNKDFSDNSPAPVSVNLVCSSGNVTLTPLNAAEGSPAVFEVIGATLGTTCVATETVPLGYTADESDCVAVALDGNCTITNTLIPPVNTITVNKDFSDNSPAPVSVNLVCSSGNVTLTPLNAAEGSPAVFEVIGATLGTTCAATETVPVGYTADQSDCVAVALDGNCTITNTLIPLVNTITVNKDFSDDSPAPVSVNLVCSSGNVTMTPLNAAEGSPAVFEVIGAMPGASCTATETVPAGYTANQTNCLSVAMGGSCTIINTLNALAPLTIPVDSFGGMFLLAALLSLLGFAALRVRSA